MVYALDGTATGLETVVTALNNGITSDSIFNTVAQFAPIIITLTLAGFALYELRKVVKGARTGKAKF